MELNRTQQPPFRIPEEIKMPACRSFKAPNGVDLYSLRSGELEVIRLSLVFKAGSSCQERPFAASATVSMLSEGSAKYTAAEIAEKLDYFGFIYDANIDRDYAVVTVCSLSKFFGEALALLEEIVLHPAFPERELTVYKNKHRQKLTVERTKVSFRARELFAQALFGKDHPYGNFYDVSEYDSLTSEHLRAHYKKTYTAENCFAVTSGFITDADISAIQALLSKIPSGGAGCAANFPEIETTHYEYAEKEGAVQSAISIGRMMFPRTHPDYIPMQVLCTILGGYFGSRLVNNLREEKGYTYGIYAAMVNLDEAGYMAIGTEVGAQFTDASVKEIFREMERLRSEPVPEDELTVVKNMMAGELMRLLDGPFGIADITMENIQNRTDNDYVNRFMNRVAAITAEELKALANKYFTEKEFVTVIVGKK